MSTFIVYVATRIWLFLSIYIASILLASLLFAVSHFWILAVIPMIVTNIIMQVLEDKMRLLIVSSVN